MARKAWVCWECKKPVRDPYQRLRRTVVFVSLKTQANYGTRFDSYVCVNCANQDLAIAEIVGGDEEQETLF